MATSDQVKNLISVSTKPAAAQIARFGSGAARLTTFATANAVTEWLTEGADATSEKFCCPDCGSTLVKQAYPDNKDQEDAEFLCAACGEAMELVPLMLADVGELTFWDAYVAGTDGGDPPVAGCPQCIEETYIFSQGGCALYGTTCRRTRAVPSAISC